MTMKVIVFAVALSGALAGCKRKQDQQPTAGSAEPTPPAMRPSQQQGLPRLPALELPDNPKRVALVELGHVLFFDKRLSGGNDRACYSCHLNEDGTGGHDPLAIGSGDKPLTRHAPTLWNVGYWKNAGYWDGRAP